jgi:hypothetical protein
MNELVRFGKYEVEVKELLGGVQAIFQFENGYGASVVQNDMSYGGMSGHWDLAVLKWDDGESSLCYDTEITDDVIGWQTPQ